MAMTTTIMWAVFGVFVIGAMAVDLGLNQHQHKVSIKEALIWSLVWMGLAGIFGLAVNFTMGHQRAIEFFTGYLVEKSLSVDNMFVFILIFNFFQIPDEYQPRVLKWGILGAIGMRFILIFTGVALLQRFEWLLYVFGALLLYTAVKMVTEESDDIKPDQNPLLRFFNRFLPFSTDFKGKNFFVREKGKLTATPLFATLLVIEASDLIFAMDSIPAVLAISSNSFVVFTSNIFAIMGLRALFFLVSGVMQLFRFLRYGLAFILIFIGAKMLLKDFFHMPVGISLLVVGVCLLISILASLIFKEDKAR